MRSIACEWKREDDLLDEDKDIEDERAGERTLLGRDHVRQMIKALDDDPMAQDSRTTHSR
jgi:hypothetical protein